MDLESYLILTPDQVSAWIEAYPDEYAEYVEYGLFEEDTRILFEPPEWMVDYDAFNGPFDFGLHPSQATWGD